MFEYLSTGPVIDLGTGSPANFALSSLSNNRLLATWSTYVESIGTTFWTRIFDPAGQPLSAEIAITGPSIWGQHTPVATELSDGRFVMAWELTNGTSSSIHAQVFSSTGAKLGTEFTVSGTPGGRQYNPGITATTDGGFAIGWNTTSLYPGGDIQVQRYDATGAVVGGNIAVNSNVSGDQTLSDMVALAAGGFVVTWRGTTDTDIHAQVVDANGAKIGQEITVNTMLAGSQSEAQVAALSGGRFVVTWTSGDLARDGSGTAVLAQIFEANGTKLGGEILVNTVTAGNQGNASVSALADGTFVIAWANETDTIAANYGSSAIRAQVFDASGVRLGSEIQVQNNTAGVEVRPNIVSLANGGFSVGWTESTGIGTNLQTQIELRTYDANTVPQIAAGATALGVSENHAVVGTFALTDGNGQPLSYGISGGADAARFTIDNSTGALSFVSAPNFEAPSDVGANNVYEVVVATTGAQSSSNQAIAVTVANVNEAPVITSNAGGNSSTVNRSENGTAVTTVLAGDQDGNSVIYSIAGGADAARFTISSTTGALSFFAAPNYEAPTDVGANNVYDVIVRASDGTLSDTQTIAVTVTNINEAPVLTSNGGGASAAISLQENTLTVTTVAATDPENATLTYSIFSGADAARFTINAQTGALQFVSNPDFEASADADHNNAYLVTVAASDSRSTVTQDLTITVTGVNEAPVITSSGGADSVSGTFNENSTSTVYVVNSTDPEGTARIYSIAGGADAARFTINSSTGQMRFLSAPNYEAPADVGGDNVYDVVVRASDGVLSDTQALSISVVNLNEAPVFTSNGGGFSANIAMAENASTVTTVAATDPDGLAVNYAITGGLDAALFAIDPNTGLLRFISAANFESPTDNGANNVYNVNVRASDGSVSTTQTIAVTVTNLNEAPLITSPGSFAASENFTAAGTVTASDPDGTSPTFSIVGGTDAALFTINGSTGALSFVSAPNFEAPGDTGGDNIYNVSVQASDGTLTATQAVIVTVTDVAEAPVIISNGGGNNALVSVGENGTAVLTVAASDPGNAAITYSIAGGADAAKFAINSATGALSFIAAPNFEAPADAGGDNVYDVIVQASNGSLTDTQAIAVSVSNVDEAPSITSNGGGSSGAASVGENATAVLTVTSSDPENTARTYTIVGGADAAKFAIDAATGTLSFIAAPDFEVPTDVGANNVYDVIVQASDGSLVDTQTLSITVANVNEAPTITSNGGNDTAAVNVAENATAVATVAATDPENATRTYSIVGGADAAKFAIDAATGALSFVAAPDFEAPGDANGDNVYDIIVQASDGVTTDNQALAVTVTNVNEVPLITSASSFSAAENGTAAGTVTASDPDGTSPTFSIVGGTDAALFTINGSTGALSFVSAPNFEAPGDTGGDNIYNVSVQASDGTLTATQAVIVTVTDVAEAPVIISNGGGNNALVSVGENGTAVLTVAASDPGNAAITYSIAGGADAAKFAINSATGALSFIAAPNFEAPADAGGDNVYDVIVQASNGSLTDTQAIAVSVSNVDEAPSITSNGGGSSGAASVGENATAVLTVTSSDPENTARTYTIVGGADAAKFAIDAATGTLSFIAAPDFEVPTDVGANNVYDVIVQASDGSLVDTQTLSITVANVNEAPTITSNGGNDTAAVNVAENATAVATVAATDPENATRTYSIVGGADAAKFAIDAATGALSFVAAPDFEAPGDANGDNVYQVVVSASDGALSDTQTLNVTVTNINEAPTITSASAFSLAENGTAAALVTSTDPEGAPRSYAIFGGADAAKFAIDAATGALSFIALPNFEVPGDADGDNVYQVSVRASDGSLSDTRALAISVTNLNEAPVIASNGGGDSATVSIAENGTAVSTVTSSDPEGTPRSYAITGGVDAARFAINATTGALAFVAAANFEAPADANGDNVYQIVVTASDGSLSDSQTLAITVTNVNETPTITSNGGGDTAAVTVIENTSAVTTVSSTDPEGTSRTYAIVGGADAARFTINAATGAVSFVAAPNFEAPTDSNADNVYQVVVSASDGSLSDSQTLAVTIANVNEAPTITSNGGGDSASITINENALVVTTLTSTDPEGVTRAYSLSGGADAAKFSINATTGELSFVAAPNFEAPTDANADNVYHVVVSASDGSLSDSQAIAVSVANVIDGVTMTGTTKADTLTGGSAEDTIQGLGGNDTLNGAGGADTIDGGDGADTLIGGAGADRLTGGAGADTFTYQALSDSTAALTDFLTDFSTAQGDKIGLSAIDANTGLAGDQAFSWIGTSAFGGIAGQLRYYQSGGDTFVTGDVNGDGVGDFLIQIDPLIILAPNNFFL